MPTPGVVMPFPQWAAERIRKYPQLYNGEKMPESTYQAVLLTEFYRNMQGSAASETIAKMKAANISTTPPIWFNFALCGIYSMSFDGVFNFTQEYGDRYIIPTHDYQFKILNELKSSSKAKDHPDYMWYTVYETLIKDWPKGIDAYLKVTAGDVAKAAFKKAMEWELAVQHWITNRAGDGVAGVAGEIGKILKAFMESLGGPLKMIFIVIVIIVAIFFVFKLNDAVQARKARTGGGGGGGGGEASSATSAMSGIGNSIKNAFKSSTPTQ